MAVYELPKSFDEFVDAKKQRVLHVKEYVENGIPYMKPETDHAPSDSGQLDTRIAAFIEMI